MKLLCHSRWERCYVPFISWDSYGHATLLRFNILETVFQEEASSNGSFRVEWPWVRCKTLVHTKWLYSHVYWCYQTLQEIIALWPQAGSIGNVGILANSLIPWRPSLWWELVRFPWGILPGFGRGRRVPSVTSKNHPTWDLLLEERPTRILGQS